MSYAAKHCRDKITDGQILMIKDMLNNERTLQAVLQAYICGSSTICDEETYTIENLPQGATVRWSYKDYLINPQPLIVKSSDGATAVYKRGTMIPNIAPDPGIILKTPTAEAQRVTGTVPYVGKQTITATVSLNGATYTLEKEVTMEKIITPDIEGAHAIGDVLPPNMMALPWKPGTTKQLEYVGKQYFFTTQANNIRWFVTYPDGSTQSLSGLTVNVTPKTTGVMTVKVVDNNQCHLANSYTARYNITYGTIIAVIHTNPASGSMDIKVIEQEGDREESMGVMKASASNPTYGEAYEGAYRLELWHEVYGPVREMDVDENTPDVTMELHGLTPGMYYLRLIVDGELLDVSKVEVR